MAVQSNSGKDYSTVEYVVELAWPLIWRRISGIHRVGSRQRSVPCTQERQCGDGNDSIE